MTNATPPDKPTGTPATPPSDESLKVPAAFKKLAGDWEAGADKGAVKLALEKLDGTHEENMAALLDAMGPEKYNEFIHD